MARKGYKGLTIKEALDKKLQDLADKLGKTKPEALEIVLNDYLARGEKVHE